MSSMLCCTAFTEHVALYRCHCVLQATTAYGQEPGRYIELFKTPSAGIPSRLLSRWDWLLRGTATVGDLLLLQPLLRCVGG